MTAPVQSIDVSIRETGPDGHERWYVSRWMGNTKERGWFTATHLGQEHTGHGSELAARAGLANWLRAQADLIQTVPTPPPVASTAGLEDLL